MRFQTIDVYKIIIKGKISPTALGIIIGVSIPVMIPILSNRSLKWNQPGAEWNLIIPLLCGTLGGIIGSFSDNEKDFIFDK
ncbi:hypothetical protein ACFLSX_03575 [Calditrichota bacterium]